MITLQEFCRYLNELLKIDEFADYCENGLQVEGTSSIKKVATAVSASLATIQAAVEADVQALIVHHGLFWNADPYAVLGTKKEKLQLLLKHNISLLAYHLPLDAHQEFGNNWKAAHDLGWTDLQPFDIGVKGTVGGISRDEFQKKLEEYYQHLAHCALGGIDYIETAALISGGAYKSLLDAASQNIDCFITGNFDEPAWHQAHEEKINFYALGHSATERVGPKALGEHIQQQFGLETIFIDIPNPF